MVSLAIFASGAGSNAARIIEHFRHHPEIRVKLLLCNKAGAGAFAVAEKGQIPALLIEKERFFRGDSYIPLLQQEGIDFIILAGFLWKLPPALIKAYPGRILNIHPALLPAYGGKGMYGRFVHEAVLKAGDTESGISIHLVDEWYDHGRIIFQACCPVSPGDTPEVLAQKIHALEHAHYPRVIEEYLLSQKQVKNALKN